MPELRLGDDLDDYCSRCKRITNHSVVSLVNGEPAKVHCRSCFFEHDYLQAKIPEKKKSAKKAQLFDAVLASITGTQDPDPKPKGDTKKAAAD